MNTHTNKKVVCVKDIPSNLIEEAIFILKSDDGDSKNPKTKMTRKELIEKETEDLVMEYSSEFFKNEKKEEKSLENKRMQNRKLKVVLGAVMVALICYLVSLII